MSSPVNSSARDRAIAIWLLVVAGMVAAMVVIGGITRLTHSGLSMVEWRPLLGWLPPLSEEAWIRSFALYQNSPEYLKVNSWMGLEDFRRIFWWEYIHRLWGRLIGLAFGVPFFWFLLRGGIRRALMPRLVLLFALGALQGGIGWWMVKSGLVDDPAVSQYRLTLHLAVAFLILGALVLTALDLLTVPHTPAPASLRAHGAGVLILVSLTVVAGALVAGLNAGMIHNTFPLMDGDILPPDYGRLSPFWLNALENPGAVQFHHRILAIITVLAVLTLLWRVIRAELPVERRMPVHVLGATVLIQAALGISTLLSVVPIGLAVTHQAGAVVLFAVTIWTVHTLRGSAGVG